VDLDVQVRPVRVTGVPDQADRLPGLHRVADLDQQAARVRVDDLGAVTLLDGDRVAVAAVETGGGHLAGVDRLVRRALDRGQVDAGVQLTEADAVPRGEVEVVQGEQPGLGLGFLVAELRGGAALFAAGGALGVGAAVGEILGGEAGPVHVLDDRRVQGLGVRKVPGAQCDESGSDEGGGTDNGVTAAGRCGYTATTAIPIGLRRQALAHEQPSVGTDKADSHRAPDEDERWFAELPSRVN
jgi:hypothetical protein